ncbi:hypothetical protein J4226_01410 [Candidatus Pacearchaeota archaeon]|nr:hypothetical protein [Candidatus Pacearchaeota archaeon]
MGKIINGLIGTGLIALAAIQSVHIYRYFKNTAMERQAYFSNLPVENIMALDSSFNAMYEKITLDLPEKECPTRREVAIHALKLNPQYSARDLTKKFGGKVMNIKLPDYDGRCNNGRHCK